jgi:argininosuccinate synthase
MKKDAQKIVLAYSGGLDTSVILRWLIDNYNAEVIAFAADLGQGEELEPLDEKARKTGASKVYIEDLKEEFVRDFVFPVIKANLVYEGSYLLGTSIARPLIAKKQMEIAALEGADAVSHGATGKGNDQVRFELTYFAFDPNITVIAPWREWTFKSRTDLIEYSRDCKIPITVTEQKPYSSDRNLFHISFEGGILEDPWSEPPEDMFLLTVSPERAPDKPTYVELEFDRGVPVAIDGERLDPVELLTNLNELAGKNGIGRVDMVESRFVGMKSRGVYETPGWFSPEAELMRKLVDDTQQTVSGTVRLKLYKGNCMVTGRKSPRSLYHPDYATFESETVYDQADAEGFIRLNALRLRINALLRK